MPKRPWLLGLMFLSVSLAYAPPAEAQRSGFIIGFGVGPGLVSYTRTLTGQPSSDRATEFGLATDFHIGGVIGDSFELYFMSKLIFFDRDPGGAFLTGVNGVGATYPLNPDFSVSGGIGFGSWEELDIFGESYTGLGLVAGGGYQLSPRWALHLDLMYTNPGDASLDYSVVGAQFTLNIVSH